MQYLKYIGVFLLVMGISACEQFEDFNENPNEPTLVPADVLLPGAIRQSVNTAVDAAYLVGNNAAQLSAKTLRLEVDAYNWNAFPSYWDGWYRSLTDVFEIERIAQTEGNEALEGAAIALRSWIFASLTNAYGDIPYFEAINGLENNFTPVYDPQEEIYADLLSQLERANTLLASGNGSINGDILFDGDAAQWRKFANSLRLRLLMYAHQQLSNADVQFASIVNEGAIMERNADNATLTYTGSFPNEFPLVNLKTGDFDAVGLAAASLSVMEQHGDPRLLRYARPNNEDFDNNPTFIGAINGQGENCTKDGASRLGVQYYNYPGFTTAAAEGLPMAEGIIMTYAEVAFLLAEAAAKGWIDADVESLYRSGIAASMEYRQVDLAPFGWSSFDDFYNNSGVAYSTVTDIWEQKWLAMFFHGLDPYFEVRRWYVESGASFDGIPFLSASCGNVNNDRLPLRFLYPGQEQSLNAANYNDAIDRMGGANSQNASMWLLQ